MSWAIMFVSREEAETALTRIRKGSTVHREAVRLEVSSKTLGKALVQLIGTDQYQALIGRTPQRPTTAPSAPPDRGRPRTAAISDKPQLQAVLERIHAGSTVKAEAKTLGLRYNVLRVVLQQVMGLAAYERLMAQQRAKRAKLPPSRNFLTEPNPTPAQNPPSSVGDPVGDRTP